MKTTTTDVRVTCARCAWTGGFDDALNESSGLMRCPSCGDRNVRRADPSEQRCAEFDALTPALVGILERSAVVMSLESDRSRAVRPQRATILHRLAHEAQAAAASVRRLMRS